MRSCGVLAGALAGSGPSAEGVRSALGSAKNTCTCYSKKTGASHFIKSSIYKHLPASTPGLRRCAERKPTTSRAVHVYEDKDSVISALSCRVQSAG
jgi:hypothetical protein